MQTIQTIYRFTHSVIGFGGERRRAWRFGLWLVIAWLGSSPAANAQFYTSGLYTAVTSNGVVYPGELPWVYYTAKVTDSLGQVRGSLDISIRNGVVNLQMPFTVDVPGPYSFTIDNVRNSAGTNNLMV